MHRGLALVLAIGLFTAGCRRQRSTDSAEPLAAPAGTGQAMLAAPVIAPVAPSPEPVSPLAVLEGKAAYYSDALAGRPTASGEPYDPRALTAAHRKLPFGTRVRVVRASSGRSVVVTINDRGPFGDERRILDLSRAAAEQLDMIRAGVVDVRAEILEYGRN